MGDRVRPSDRRGTGTAVSVPSSEAPRILLIGGRDPVSDAIREVLTLAGEIVVEPGHESTSGDPVATPQGPSNGDQVDRLLTEPAGVTTIVRVIRGTPDAEAIGDWLGAVGPRLRSPGAILLVGIEDASGAGVGWTALSTVVTEQARRLGPRLRLNYLRFFAISTGPRPILGRSGRPDDVAASVAFLCAPGAAFITGVTLRLDGGASLRWPMDGASTSPDQA